MPVILTTCKVQIQSCIHNVDHVTQDVARHHLRVLKSRLLEAKADSEEGDLSFLSTAFEDLEIEY